MTEASYTAWDDKVYVWPPPAGWYRSSDGKWWPEGYGPQEGEDGGSEADLSSNPEAPPQPETFSPSEAFPPSDTPADADSASNGSWPPTTAPESFGKPEASVAEVPLVEISSAEISGVQRSGAEIPSSQAPVSESGPADAPDVEARIADGPGQKASGSEGSDKGTTPAALPWPAGEPPARPGAAVDPSLDALRPQEHDISAPDHHEILESTPKGSSRAWLVGIVGALLLAVIGAGVYFALGGDEEMPEAVDEGPPLAGSFTEPHPRASGVVVYYPIGDTDQRWIVEVLEPARDATAELGEADAAEGVVFAATRLRVRNESGAEGASVDDLRFNAVSTAGEVTVRTDSQCPAAADDLDVAATVPVGEAVEGTVCWALPAADLDGLLLGIESPKVQGRVHISLR